MNQAGKTTSRARKWANEKRTSLDGFLNRGGDKRRKLAEAPMTDSHFRDDVLEASQSLWEALFDLSANSQCDKSVKWKNWVKNAHLIWSHKSTTLCRRLGNARSSRHIAIKYKLLITWSALRVRKYSRFDLSTFCKSAPQFSKQESFQRRDWK